MSASQVRLVTAILVGIFVVAGLSGCFGKRGGSDPAESADPARLALSFIGLGAPEGGDDVILDVMIDHVALLTEDGTWRDIFSEVASAEVVFEDGFGEPAFLADVPVPPGTYTAIEIIATAATVTDTDGTATATVESVACYSDITIAPEEGNVAELQLLLSGPDALETDGTSWVFRPAIVGSLAPEDPEGEAAIDEPDCRAI